MEGLNRIDTTVGFNSPFVFGGSGGGIDQGPANIGTSFINVIIVVAALVALSWMLRKRK